MLTRRKALLGILFTPAIIRTPGLLMPVKKPKWTMPVIRWHQDILNINSDYAGVYTDWWAEFNGQNPEQIKAFDTLCKCIGDDIKEQMSRDGFMRLYLGSFSNERLSA